MALYRKEASQEERNTVLATYEQLNAGDTSLTDRVKPPAMFGNKVSQMQEVRSYLGTAVLLDDPDMPENAKPVENATGPTFKKRYIARASFPMRAITVELDIPFTVTPVKRFANGALHEELVYRVTDSIGYIRLTGPNIGKVSDN